MKYDGIMESADGSFRLVRSATNTRWIKGKIEITSRTKFSLGRYLTEEAAQVQLDKSQSPTG